MIPNSAINYANLALIFLASITTTTAADLKPKPDDESRFIIEPVCANPYKAGHGGADTTAACQQAIDNLYAKGSDNVKGVKGKCKQVAKSGNCVVALCDTTNEDANLAKSGIALVAQGIHAYCKKGAKDYRLTGGSAVTSGMQPYGETRLGGTIWLGQMGFAPKPAAKRRSLDPDTEDLEERDEGVFDLDVITRSEERNSDLTTRAAGDAWDIGGGWRLRVLEWGRWQTSQVTQGHLNVAGSMLVADWDPAQPNNDPTVVTGRANVDTNFQAVMQVRARNNHNVADVPRDFHNTIRQRFVQSWVDEGRPGMMGMAIERTTDPTSELQTYEQYAEIVFMEVRLAQPGDAPQGFKFFLGEDGLHFGGFGSLPQ